MDRHRRPRGTAAPAPGHSSRCHPCHFPQPSASWLLLHSVAYHGALPLGPSSVRASEPSPYRRPEVGRGPASLPRARCQPPAPGLCPPSPPSPPCLLCPEVTSRIMMCHPGTCPRTTECRYYVRSCRGVRSILQPRVGPRYESAVPPRSVVRLAGSFRAITHDSVTGLNGKRRNQAKRRSSRLLNGKKRNQAKRRSSR